LKIFHAEPASLISFITLRGSVFCDGGRDILTVFNFLGGSGGVAEQTFECPTMQPNMSVHFLKQGQRERKFVVGCGWMKINPI